MKPKPIKPLPCPFCGYKFRGNYDVCTTYIKKVECGGCGAEGPFGIPFKSEHWGREKELKLIERDDGRSFGNELVKAWNKRQSPAPSSRGEGE
jgi:hypothetical protein